MTATAMAPSAAPARRGGVRGWLPWLALAVVVVTLLSIGASRTSTSHDPAAREDRIAHRLRCPVCQSESVAESESATSTAIRADIANRIRSGQSDHQIEQAYVDRYGEWILLTPSNGGLGFLVWGIPVVAMVLGAALIIAFVRGGRRPVAWAVGATIVAVIAAFALTSALGDRRPGQTATGNDATASTEDPITTLKADVAARPRSYAARIAYARALVGRDLAEAVRQYDAAARLDPTQAEPFAYTGWLEAIVANQVSNDGQRRALLDAAVERLATARRLDPEYPDAQAFSGIVLLDFRDDPAGAVPFLQRYLQLAPDGPQVDLVRSALARATAAASTTATGSR